MAAIARAVIVVQKRIVLEGLAALQNARLASGNCLASTSQ